MSEYSLSFWLVLLIELHDPIYVQESHLRHRSIKYFALRRGFMTDVLQDEELKVLSDVSTGRGFSLRWILR